MDCEIPLLIGSENSDQIREMGYEGNVVGVIRSAFQDDIDNFKDHGENDKYESS